MKLAGFYDESISNGLGWRAVIFVSGCPHNCENCHNKEAQDFNYGTEFNSKEIIEKICDNSILKGVTLSGGEPLCKENVAEVLKFIQSLKKEKSSLNIWCYTGYTYEELVAREDDVTKEALGNIDVLIDGPFVDSCKAPNLKFRGSTNQRIIDLKNTLQNNSVIELAV